MISHKSSFWSHEFGTGYHGYTSPTGKEALRKWQRKLLLSASDKIHATVYLHKSMLNDSTHIGYVVHSMQFRTQPMWRHKSTATTPWMCGAYRFVFDGGTGHTQVELPVLFDAGVDQSLDRSLFLEEQEGVAWREEQKGI